MASTVAGVCGVSPVAWSSPISLRRTSVGLPVVAADGHGFVVVAILEVGPELVEFPSTARPMPGPGPP